MSKTLERSYRGKDEQRDMKAAQKRRPETRKTEKQQWSDEVDEELISEDTDDYGYWYYPLGGPHEAGE